MMTRTAFFLLCATLLVAGCSTERDANDLYAPNDVDRLVVDALLFVDQPFPSIVLSRAQRPDQLYDRFRAGERGATITVTDRATGRVIPYIESALRGLYSPGTADTVKANTTYDLAVTTSAGEAVTAVTTTPSRFSVAEWLLLETDGQTVRGTFRTFTELGDSVYYAPENQVVYADGLLEARFQRPDVPAFQVGISSLDLDSDFVIDPDFFEEEDFADLERNGASPALEALDGKVRLPWFAIFFQGRYKIRVLALDTNTFDLVRSTPDDGGGLGFGGNIGDSFERPIFHLEGGIGLFGSAAIDSIGFFVLPRP